MDFIKTCMALWVIFIIGTQCQGQDYSSQEIARAIEQAKHMVRGQQLPSFSSRDINGGGFPFASPQEVGRGFPFTRPQDGRSALTGHRVFTKRNHPSMNRRLSNGAAVLETAFQTLRGSRRPLGTVGIGERSGMSPQSSAIFKAHSGDLCDDLPNEICNPKQRYRVTNGECNNLKFRSEPSQGLKLGAAFTAQGRFLEPDYDDGISIPRIRSAVSGDLLPNARFVSIRVHSGNDLLSDKHTPFLTHFGQFIDHDVVSTPTVEPDFRYNDSHCCAEPNTRECFNINFKHDRILGGSCIPFPRADIGPDFFCEPGLPRKQINQRSSFVDGSMIYGFDTEKENALRLKGTGYLISDNDNQLKLTENSDDVPCFPFSEPKCFDAGDHRSMETPILTVIHIAFVRRHNMIVSALMKLDPTWSPELLFQEAKKIVIAELQHILYNEFLPRVLGQETMLAYKLFPSENLFDDAYNPNVDPRTTSSFSVAAYRFGHSLVRNIHDQIGPKGRPVRHLDIQDHFEIPMSILRPFPGGSTEAFARWMSIAPKSKYDGVIVDGLRNNLFRCNESPDPNGPGPFGPKCLIGGRATEALDLAALNIQRGRDHGLPPYIVWRYHCTGKRTLIFTPNALGLSDHSPYDANILRNTYRHVGDIDLFAGGLTEKRLPGALVGPTFGCILAAQFRNYKQGDRFWYERPDPVLGFTPGQLRAIKETSLAKIICSTMNGVEGVQAELMRLPSKENPRISCSALRSRDLMTKIRRHWSHLPQNAFSSAAEKERINIQKSVFSSTARRYFESRNQGNPVQSLLP